MATQEKQTTLDILQADEKEAAVPFSPSDSGEDLEATHGINEKTLLRKLDFNLLPAVTLLYLLSFLDRSNGIATMVRVYDRRSNYLLVANARIEGLATDLHISKEV